MHKKLHERQGSAGKKKKVANKKLDIIEMNAKADEILHDNFLKAALSRSIRRKMQFNKESLEKYSKRERERIQGGRETVEDKSNERVTLTR